MNKIKTTYILLIVITNWLILTGLSLAFLYAPTEKTMGDVQRIFYFHVPSAWVSFIAFFVVCIASIIFLKTGKEQWDRLAACSAEIGVLFIVIVLITGPLWAKPVWGHYWTWDPRLTTSFVLFLIYVAYLMLRNYVANKERGARFAAVFGIIGFVDVPIVYMSIRWWKRGMHPEPVIAASSNSGLENGLESGLAPEMLTTLMFCLLAFTFLYITLLVLRYHSEGVYKEFQALKHKLHN